jgi:hypothetical protein
LELHIFLFYCPSLGNNFDIYLSFNIANQETVEHASLVLFLKLSLRRRISHWPYETWDYHGDDCEGYCILECHAVLSGRCSPAFRRNALFYPEHGSSAFQFSAPKMEIVRYYNGIWCGVVWWIFTDFSEVFILLTWIWKKHVSFFCPEDGDNALLQWDMMRCILVDFYRRFGRMYSSNLKQ